MALFLRFTDNPQADIRRGYSIHTTPFYNREERPNIENVEWSKEIGAWVQKLTGLCGFYVENEEEANALVKKMREESFLGFVDLPAYLFVGELTEEDCPEGDVFVPSGEYKLLEEEVHA